MILRENFNHPDNQINLRGISIGNGDVSPLYQFPLQGEAAFLANVINKTTHEQVKILEGNCQALLQKQQWSPANDMCNQIIMAVLIAAGNINPMNYKLHCKIQDCFVYTNLTDYMNLPRVKQMLGVPSNITWQTCNMDIQFTDEDQMSSVVPDITEILKAGIRVLVYYGDLDLVCPWNGGLNWMLNTPWEGQENFVAAPLNPWIYNGKTVGYFKGYQNFQYLKVKDAGHMTPEDQPEVSLELFSRFIHNKPFN